MDSQVVADAGLDPGSVGAPVDVQFAFRAFLKVDRDDEMNDEASAGLP